MLSSSSLLLSQPSFTVIYFATTATTIKDEDNSTHVNNINNEYNLFLILRLIKCRKRKKKIVIAKGSSSVQFV